MLERLSKFLSYGEPDYRIGPSNCNRMCGVYYWEDVSGDYNLTRGNKLGAVVFKVNTINNIDEWKRKMDNMTQEADWDIIGV